MTREELEYNVGTAFAQILPQDKYDIFMENLKAMPDDEFMQMMAELVYKQSQSPTSYKCNRIV